MVQAGPLELASGDWDVLQVQEKIAQHWKLLGFSEWSNSDDAWLAMWTGDTRSQIKEVVPHLFAV